MQTLFSGSEPTGTASLSVALFAMASLIALGVGPMEVTLVPFVAEDGVGTTPDDAVAVVDEGGVPADMGVVVAPFPPPPPPPPPPALPGDGNSLLKNNSRFDCS